MNGQANLHVSLTEDLKDFVDARVSSGEYASASEVVSNALHLMGLQEENAAKLKWLQQAYREGIESGDAGEWDFEVFKIKARARLKAESER